MNVKSSLTGCFVILMVASCALQGHADDYQTQRIQKGLVQQGEKLTSLDAKRLETFLKTHPDRLETHLKLLGYYQRHVHDNDQARSIRGRQILWLIRHHPESRLSASDYTEDSSVLDEVYPQIERAWLKQIRRYWNDPTVLSNAALFFLINDNSEQSLQITQRLRVIDPQNPEWPSQVAYFYDQKSRDWEKGRFDLKWTKRALLLREKSYALARNDDERLRFFSELPLSALMAHDAKKAEDYAHRLLEMVHKNPRQWGVQEGLFKADKTLALLAVKRKDLKEADRLLLEPAQYAAYFDADFFQFDVSLPQLLLKAGEKDTVLEYLRLCRKQWAKDEQLRDMVDGWIHEIETTGTSDLDEPG